VNPAVTARRYCRVVAYDGPFRTSCHAAEPAAVNREAVCAVSAWAEITASVSARSAKGLLGKNRIGRSDAEKLPRHGGRRPTIHDLFPRHGGRRPTIHDLQCWSQQSRGWPACTGHDATGRPCQNRSALSPTSPKDLSGNNRIGWSEADDFHRRGGRRPAIHDLQCWSKQSRGWPACAGHGATGRPCQNRSALSPTSPKDLSVNNRIGWSESDYFHRHGGRRPAIYDLQCWSQQGRGWPACTGHDATGRPCQNRSGLSPTSPKDLSGNNRIGWSEADDFHRHGGRRPAIHDLQCWSQQSRGWPACAGHDGIGGPSRNWSALSPTSPKLTDARRASRVTPCNSVVSVRTLKGDGRLGAPKHISLLQDRRP